MSYALVLYYSKHGGTLKIAKEIARGIEANGIEAKLRTVPAITATTTKLEDRVPNEGPPYATNEDLANCLGLAMGSPTRFGNMAAELKYFIDNTSKTWLSGGLINKPATVFTSTGSMHGGQETTLLTMMLPLMHHGMIICGIPYSVDELNSTTSGGTPYGSSHVSGIDGKLNVTDDELAIAYSQGYRLADIINKMKK